jgi:hypothetical protein
MYRPPRVAPVQMRRRRPAEKYAGNQGVEMRSSVQRKEMHDILNIVRHSTALRAAMERAQESGPEISQALRSKELNGILSIMRASSTLQTDMFTAKYLGELHACGRWHLLIGRGDCVSLAGLFIKSL